MESDQNLYNSIQEANRLVKDVRQIEKLLEWAESGRIHVNLWLHGTTEEQQDTIVSFYEAGTQSHYQHFFGDEARELLQDVVDKRTDELCKTFINDLQAIRQNIEQQIANLIQPVVNKKTPPNQPEPPDKEEPKQQPDPELAPQTDHVWVNAQTSVSESKPEPTGSRQVVTNTPQKAIPLSQLTEKELTAKLVKVFKSYRCYSAYIHKKKALYLIDDIFKVLISSSDLTIPPYLESESEKEKLKSKILTSIKRYVKSKTAKTNWTIKNSEIARVSRHIVLNMFFKNIDKFIDNNKQFISPQAGEH